MKRKMTLDDEMGSSLFGGVERFISKSIKTGLILGLTGTVLFTSCSKKDEETYKTTNNKKTHYLENTQQIPGVEYTLGGLIEIYQNKLKKEVNPEEILKANMNFYNEKTGTFSKYCCSLNQK